MGAFTIRPLVAEDHSWLQRFIIDHWGGEQIIVHGKEFFPAGLPGFAAERNGWIVGLATYSIEEEACELVSLNSLERGSGIGAALLQAVRQAAESQSCRRLWLITTNDNINALRFYQKYGLQMVAVYPNAVEKARRLKPSIPLVGEDGIPIRDEIKLEMVLQPAKY